MWPWVCGPRSCIVFDFFFFNNRFLRERGMASTLKMEYIPGFSMHFPNKLSYGYLRFEGDSQQGRTFSLSLPSQRNFPISFKPKVAIAKFVWKMQKKIWYYEKWVGRHASFPPRRSVNRCTLVEKPWKKLFIYQHCNRACFRRDKIKLNWPVL